MNKLIIVPSQHPLVDNHCHTMNVGGTLVNTNFSSQTIPTTDPVDLILATLIPMETSTWTVKNLTATTLPMEWDYDDTMRLSDWAEENCRAPLVLCRGQPQFNAYPGLVVYVCDGVVRQQQLLKWVHGNHLPKHKFCIETGDYDDMLEIERWLSETVAPENYACSTLTNNVRVTIRDEEAAVAFKLRWCENEAKENEAPF